MTDLEKFQELFDEVGIKYRLYEDEDTNGKHISVQSPFDDDDGRLYKQALEINFNENDAFKDFYVIGD